MLCLNIRQQFARIEVSSEMPKLSLTNGGATPKVEVTSSAAILDIKRQNGSLDIDNTSSRYSVGLKNPTDFARDSAEQGMQALKNYAARLTEDGNQKNQAKGDPATIANIAQSRMIKSLPGIRIDRVAAPKISYTPGKLSVNYQPGKVNTEVKRVTIEPNFQRGEVNVNLAVRPDINMWTTEGKFDTKI